MGDDTGRPSGQKWNGSVNLNWGFAQWALDRSGEGRRFKDISHALDAGLRLLIESSGDDPDEVADTAPDD